MRRVGTLLYPNFELLDVFGPLEVLGWRDDLFSLALVGLERGPVASNMGVSAMAERALADGSDYDVLLVPGGWGEQTKVDVAPYLDWIRATAERAEYVLTVCTGAALLASTGFLDGRRATTNKALFHWVTSNGPRVSWVTKARWVRDGNIFTSSGVSAGIDMTLAALEAMAGTSVAEAVATGCEYRWQRNPADDPFAAVHGLG
jgi:transcriptional regulator GlxA family with amidase domain